MADQRRGRSPRRKSRPRSEQRTTIPASTRHTPGDRIEELAMIGEADLDTEDVVGADHRHPDDQDHDHDSEPVREGEDDRAPRGEERPTRPEPRTASREGGGRGSRGGAARGGQGRGGGGRGGGQGRGGGDDRGNRNFGGGGRDDVRDENRGNARPDSAGSRGGARDDDHPDDREDFEGREAVARTPEDGAAPATDTPRRPAPNRPPEEEFTIQVFYDKANGIFLASCLEFPDLKTDGHRREDVVEEMNQKIGDELEMMRREGKQLPTPFSARVYPEKLELRLSKNLFRRLDIQSRQDRVPMDQLVTELLTIALNRRPDGMGRAQQGARPQGQGQHKGEHRGGGNNRRGGGGQGGGGGRGGRDRNYHDTMGNRDNFMEYVRNLEKTGGYGKKR